MTAAALLSVDALDVAEMGGITLDTRQRQVLADGMRTTPAGRWAASRVSISLPLDADVLLARELAGLFLLGERVVHTASRHGTVAAAFARVDEAIAGSSLLRRRVRRITRVHGGEGIELDNGARARFASWKSVRGQACDLLITEEAESLGEVFGMLLPCVAGRRDPQIWREGPWPGA